MGEDCQSFLGQSARIRPSLRPRLSADMDGPLAPGSAQLDQRIARWSPGPSRRDRAAGPLVQRPATYTWTTTTLDRAVDQRWTIKARSLVQGGGPTLWTTRTLWTGASERSLDQLATKPARHGRLDQPWRLGRRHRGETARQTVRLIDDSDWSVRLGPPRSLARCRRGRQDSALAVWSNARSQIPSWSRPSLCTTPDEFWTGAVDQTGAARTIAWTSSRAQTGPAGPPGPPLWTTGTRR